MTNYFRKGDDTYYDCEVFEQTTSKNQIIRFYFDNMTEALPFEDRLATIVYNVGILIDDAETIDDDEYLLDMYDKTIRTTGRAPVENALKAVRMFKDCVECLRHKNPDYRIAFACSWLDEKRHGAYKKVLTKMGFEETIVDGEEALYKVFPAIDQNGYERRKKIELDEEAEWL